jgi:preprotein translocase subunit SecG
MQKLTEYLFVIFILLALAFGLNWLAQNFVGLNNRTAERIVKQ